MDEKPPVEPTRIYRLSASVRLMLIGLVMAVLLLAVAVVLMWVAVYSARQYIEGKGEQRDRENAELNRRIDDAVQEGKCDLLDQLPAGGFLDRLRATYNCGPGIPLSDLTPEERAQLHRRDQDAEPAAPTAGDTTGLLVPTPASPADAGGARRP